MMSSTTYQFTNLDQMKSGNNRRLHPGCDQKGMSTECVNQIIVSCDGQLPDCAGVLTHAFNQYLESYFYS